jgi:mRNA interferase HigB
VRARVIERLSTRRACSSNRRAQPAPHAATVLATAPLAVTRLLPNERPAQWKSIVDLRKNYPHADALTVASKRTVIVLNVAGNKYRLIIAVHFNTQTVFTLRLLTHAEYSKDHWKNEL